MVYSRRTANRDAPVPDPFPELWRGRAPAWVLAGHLKRAGHCVAVATFYGGGPLEHDLVRQGVPIHSLGKRSRWDVPGFFWRLIRMVRRMNPAVVYGFLGSANILTVLIKPLFPSVRIVWGVRACNMDLRQYGWLDRLLFRIECALAGFADRIIVNSKAGRDYVVNHGFPTDKMVVIPNGIDTERFKPNLSARSLVRQAWGIGDDEFLIGLVGRLDPMKDQDTFVRAAGLLVGLRPAVRFVCVGDGPAERRRALEALADELGLGERMLWKGATSDIAPVYCALDLLTLSSAFGEGFPNVVAEAMACGTPCVVTDVGDASLLVGETGLVVPPRDPDALCKAWGKALAWSGDERAARGRQARERIVRQFSVDRMVEATLKELELIADTRLIVATLHPTIGATRRIGMRARRSRSIRCQSSGSTVLRVRFGREGRSTSRACPRPGSA